MRKEILNIQNLTLKKHEEVLLQNVQFRMYDKEIVGLIAREDKGASDLIEYIYSQAKVSVCVVEQHSHLLDSLSIAENVFVVRKRFRKFFINKNVLEDQLRRYCLEEGILLQVDKTIAELTEYERCVVELIKADILGVSLVILDNPSNYISQMRLRIFHDMLKKYKKKGMSFLYIGYHHQEVFRIADRTALLANGFIKKIFQSDEMTDEMIAPYVDPILKRPSLHERAWNLDGYIRKEAWYPGERNGNLSDSMGEENIKIQLSEFCIPIKKSECIAIIDMDNGLKGEILDDVLNGKKEQVQVVFPKESRYLIIPEDVLHGFLFQDLSYFDNLIFILDRKLGKSILPKRIKESIRESYRKKVGDVVDANNIHELNTIDLLRLVYYKALLYKPDVVICLQPYAGGDVHCRMEVTRLIRELQSNHIAVLIISSNFADILDVTNQIMLIKNGKIREMNDKYS